jgi:hypothetical protein
MQGEDKMKYSLVDPDGNIEWTVTSKDDVIWRLMISQFADYELVIK